MVSTHSNIPFDTFKIALGDLAFVPPPPTLAEKVGGLERELAAEKKLRNASVDECSKLRADLASVRLSNSLFKAADDTNNATIRRIMGERDTLRIELTLANEDLAKATKRAEEAEAKVPKPIEWRSVPHKQAVNALLEGWMVRDDEWNDGAFVAMRDGEIIDEAGFVDESLAYDILTGRFDGRSVSWSIAKVDA